MFYKIPLFSKELDKWYLLVTLTCVALCVSTTKISGYHFYLKVRFLSELSFPTSHISLTILGSPEALSDISSYFENMGNGGRDEQERRTRKAQQITMYRKQDKCPGTAVVLNSVHQSCP